MALLPVVAAADCESDVTALEREYELARVDIGAVREELVDLKNGVSQESRAMAEHQEWFGAIDAHREAEGVLPPRFRYDPLGAIEEMQQRFEDLIRIYGAHIRAFRTQLPLHEKLSRIGEEIAAEARLLATRCPDSRLRGIESWGRKNVADGRRGGALRARQIADYQDEIGNLQRLKIKLRRLKRRMEGG